MVKLKSIAEKIDEAAFGWETYYNPENGKFVYLSDDGSLMDDEMKILARKIEVSSDFLRLPNLCDINDYRIMRDLPVNLATGDCVLAGSNAIACG